MKTQIEGFGIKDLIKSTSLPGWILLSRPVIYILFSRQRDLNEYSAVDFSAMVFILYAFVAFIVGINCILRSPVSFGIDTLRKTPLSLFILYSILGIISMAWSVNPSLSGFRAFECIAMTVLIVAVIQRLFETGRLRYVILWSLVYCTWDILWSIFRATQWATEIGMLTEASQMMATSFFYMALYFKPRRWYNYLIIIMSVFSMSTVAYIGMGIGLISAFWEKGRTRLLAVVAAYGLFVAVVGIGPYTILKNTIFFDKNDISIEETSGRDHLMDIAIECVDDNPYGLGFFAAEPYVLYAKHFGAISAHNSLASAAMGLGIPGIIVLSLFFISMGVTVFSKHIPRDYRSIMIGCFCVAFVHCIGNPSVGTRVFGAWMPCMYIFVLICGMYVYDKYFEPIEKEV